MAAVAIVDDALLANNHELAVCCSWCRSLHLNKESAMIKAIKFVSIPVTDQDKALAFYTEKLGFRVFTDAPFDDKQRWIELGIPRAETKVVLFTTDAFKPLIGSFMNISFTCDDLDSTYKQLKAKGVEIVKEPQKADWGSFAIFKDVDGNQFVLSSS
jgi:predicted enzyme related to lactoylglutathione lyase